MALINGYYVHVTEEEFVKDVASSTHPVEDSFNLTDNIRKQARQLSIKGKIVNNGGRTAKDVVAKLEAIEDGGTLVSFTGRNVFSSMQIQSFRAKGVNTNNGGYDFDMLLLEVRTAKNSFIAPKNPVEKHAGLQQIQPGKNEEVYHTVKKGDTVWALVTKSYTSLSPTNGMSNIQKKCDWIMSKNGHAFSRPGDFTTMQIGRKLLMGTRTK